MKNEPKTFSDLSLQDVVYFNTSHKYGNENITKLEDGDHRNEIKITFEDNEEEALVFPAIETYYKDPHTEIEYTTDEELYNTWIKPYLEKDIHKKEELIKSIQSEIDEIKERIKRMNVISIPNG